MKYDRNCRTPISRVLESFFLEPRYADKKKKKDKQIPRRIE